MKLAPRYGATRTLGGSNMESAYEPEIWETEDDEWYFDLHSMVDGQFVSAEAENLYAQFD